MINAQELQGNWMQIRGKLREKWGQLTDDDLQFVGGNIDRLIGRIEERTGVAREKVETFIDELAQSSATLLQKGGHVLQDATARAKQGYDQVADQVRGGYDRAEEMVVDHPMTSVVGVFACGLISGIFLGMMLNSRD